VRSGRNRFVLRAVVAGLALTAAVQTLAGTRAAIAAPADGDDGFDDPKLVREIKPIVPLTRPVLTPVPTATATAPVPPPPVVAKSPPLAPPPVVAKSPAPPAISPPAIAYSEPPKPVADVAAKAPVAPAETESPPALAAVPPPPPSRSESTPSAPGVDVAAHNVAPDATAPASSHGPWPYAPRLKLSYRRFPFAHAGTAAPSTPSIVPSSSLSSPESFESISVDLYPISWYLRVGLSTQFGWESGQFDRSGDYFIAESASVGFQLPGRFTPFVEALAGGGYMRRVQTDGSLPTAYWQLGIDAGVEIYLASRAYVSLAGGYLHPGNLYLVDQNLMSVKADTWSLKVGLGI
jgi:hypothetical protein